MVFFNRDQNMSYILIAHHLLGGDGGFDSPDGALVDVYIQSQALEPSEEEHHRDGEDPS